MDEAGAGSLADKGGAVAGTEVEPAVDGTVPVADDDGFSYCGKVSAIECVSSSPISSWLVAGFIGSEVAISGEGMAF